MNVRAVTAGDIEPTTEALISAFADDPLITFLFGASRNRTRDVGAFFRILLEVRVALRMPAFCVDEGGQIAGGVMGYDTTRPTWDHPQLAAWAELMGSVHGLEANLHEYESLADRFAPPAPHYYLGVIGVRAGHQGSGIGRALIERFCDRSAQDSASTGTFLETSSEASLRFYLRNGFVLRGEGRLGTATPLWCVFRPAEAGAHSRPAGL